MDRARRFSFWAVPVALAMLGAVAGGVAAQQFGMPGLDASKPIGAPPAATNNAAPTEGMPPTFTTAQANRGQGLYLQNCAACHGENLNDGEFGGAPLNGNYFHDHWAGLSVGDLFGFLSSAMPPDRPGQLSPQTYADITAFLLSRNGYNPSGQELPSNVDTLANMAMAQ